MVWRDRQEFRLELIAFADVDRDDLGEASLFMNFVAVRCRPGPDLDHSSPLLLPVGGNHRASSRKRQRLARLSSAVQQLTA